MSDPSNNLSFFKIPLDCSKDDRNAVNKHNAALLAASKLYNNYSQMKKKFPGTEPERFAEAWLLQSLIRSDEEFENLVVIYFTKILSKIGNNKKTT